MNALPPGLQPFRDAVAYRSLNEAVGAHPAVAVDPRPDSALAGDGSITFVWVRDPNEGLFVEMDHATGVRVQFTPAPPALQDPTIARERYASQAEQDAASTNRAAAVVHVLGVPGYLIPDGAAMFANGESQGTPALLEFVLGERNVSIIAHLDDETMLEIARSMVSE